MNKNRTLAVEIDKVVETLILSENDWQVINQGGSLQKEIKHESDEDAYSLIFRFNPENYKSGSLVIEYDDGGVCFVGTMADVDVYSLMDLN